MFGGQGWEEKENGRRENFIAYSGNMLDIENAMEHGTEKEEVGSQLPVGTR